MLILVGILVKLLIMLRTTLKYRQKTKVMEKLSGQLPSILIKEYGMKVTILLIMV